MPSDHSRRWTPDVFVSYEVTDSNVESFTSILFAKLEQAGIGFRDSHKRAGDPINAIWQARFALVVFSENYANSGQRLTELVNILLRRGNSKYPRLVVIPIFHGIVPAKVMESGAKDEFKKALRSFPKNEKDGKKEEWGRALAEVEKIPGYDLQKDANGWNFCVIGRIVRNVLFLDMYGTAHPPLPQGFGPFGGSSKKPWHSDEIKGIQILYTEFIQTVTFGTTANEQEGKNDGKDHYKVKLNTEEDIISFHGHFQEAEGGRVRFKALRFRTTLGRDVGVGQIDDGREDYFSVPLPSDAGKVVEFFGSQSGDGLASIGARVELTREVSCPPGLFGGTRGVRWDAKRHATVKGIRALRDSSGNRCIRSIAFRFDNDKWWWPPGSDKKWHMEFTINDPDEYLSSISGCYTYNGITSLTFLTNKKSAITIGDGTGTHFSSLEMDYGIVGSYGWSDEHLLYGIGEYFERIPNTPVAKSIGPFGGVIAWDDGKFKGVKEFCLANKDGIRYVKIVYDDGSKEGHTAIHGDSTEDFSGYIQTVKLNCSQEYLISISGYTREDGCIGSLTFCSNRRIKTVGPKKGDYFWYPSNKSRIVGFYGTCSKSLNSIGVHEEPIPQWKSSEYKPNGFSCSGQIDWDDKDHSNVVGYRVTKMGSSQKKLKIESITFMYENNGSLVEGSRHGGGDPSSGDWVMLDYPKERLDGITGYWCIEDTDTIIHDLTIFTTNINSSYAERGELNSNSASASASNPMSEPKSKKFTILERPEKRSEQGRRIVGFFGRAKTCLNFIGAHLEP
ncbi:myrosinase-binding protein 1-like [Eucalyptus grandis]|uniref:myrosinase-binding protein 1-like n=1 Tax=Eucalyptus grandis TaxID=71139 RepID=UPI00192E8DD9|nr:myrosinase-binding protein 1-like [Eucalyptus grandis]